MIKCVMARYGMLRHIGKFLVENGEIRVGDKCILRTDRGQEVGSVLSRPEELTPEHESDIVGEVLRKMSEEDGKRLVNIEDEIALAEQKYCQTKIREHDLPMRLACVEHLFGGERIIFYFLAEGRVDFRQLVKDVASEYRTRIEMRQIGVRDEARLLADYEHCGRELCCKSFMRDLEPVTMRMAKSQKTTLDPAKISGRCGRLMCCLRFEDETYGALRKQLPKKGTKVAYGDQGGEVVNQDVIKQLVTLELEDGTSVTVPVSDVQTGPAEQTEGSADAAPGDAESAEPTDATSDTPEDSPAGEQKRAENGTDPGHRQPRSGDGRRDRGRSGGRRPRRGRRSRGSGSGAGRQNDGRKPRDDGPKPGPSQEGGSGR